MKDGIRCSLLVAAALVTFAATALADGWDDCDYTAQREASEDAGDAKRLRVIAHAGSLRIQGRQGAGEVNVSGTACSSSSSQLDEIRLETERRGDEVIVRALIPTSAFGWRSYARLDMELDVPAGLALEVDDGSGSVVIRDVASVEIEDGSGEIEIDRVAGDVVVSDGSGSISANVIEGSVMVREDGSGSIHLTDVVGDVVIREDGSGGITIRRVRGNVLIGDDGSGSITVADVSGDVTVEDDGSGGIYVEDIGGEVSIPD